MNPEFVEILKSTQKELLLLLPKKLAERGYTDFILNDKFIYAKGTIPIMLVSHMDTVHRSIPKDIYFDRRKQVIWSPQGIGGDDRCGIFSTLQITKTLKPYVLFTTDEETGCRGASEAAKVLKDETGFRFLIELDRRGTDDAVFYQCANEEFQKFICDYGFQLKTGSCSDITKLSPVFNVASTNVSIGYRDEHHDIETIHLYDMYDTIEKVKKILTTPEIPEFEYKEKTYNYVGRDYYYYDDYEDYGKFGTYWDTHEWSKEQNKVIEVPSKIKAAKKTKESKKKDKDSSGGKANRGKNKVILLEYSKEYQETFKGYDKEYKEMYADMELESLLKRELQVVAIMLGVERHTAVSLSYDQLIEHIKKFYEEKAIKQAISDYFTK